MQNANNNIFRIKIYSIFYSFFLFIILMLNEVAFFSGEFQGRTSYYIQLLIIILATIDIILVIQKIKKDTIYQYMRFIFPYVLLLVWSVFLVVLTHSIEMSEVIITGLYWIIPVFLAFVTFVELGTHAIELTYKVILANYTCVIFRCIQTYGIGYFFRIENYVNNYGSILEVHSIGLAIGVFLIYFYFLHNTYGRKLDWIFWFGIVYMFLCGKRIALLAFFLIILIYRYSESRKTILQKKKLRIYTIVLLCIAFLYLFLVRINLFQIVCSLLNINAMSRFETWDILSNQYSLSPFYLGKGIGYSMNFLNDYISSRGYGYWMIAGDVHNDILKTYIDVGFIPFIVYFVWFIRMNVNYYLKRKRVQTAFLFFLVTFYTVILMFTDNIMRYSLYLLVLYLVPVSMCAIEQKHMDSHI